MGVIGKLFGGNPSEQVFWDWFSENSDRLMQVQTSEERVCRELHSRLQRFNKHLVFVFGRIEDGRREFVISADGVTSAFPTVQRLVDAAPDLPDWNIVAFVPPCNFELRVRLADRAMDANDIWFSAFPEQERVGLVLYIRDLCPENEKLLESIAAIMLTHTLGEYDYNTRIGGIATAPLPPDPVGMGLKSVRELPDTVSRMTSGG